MRIYITLILFLVGQIIFAQSAIIKQENKVSKAKGIEKMYALIDLSKMYYDAKSYKKAITPAKEAKILAKKARRSGIQALAMNREAVAAYEGGSLGRKRANKLLRESLEVLPKAANRSLRIENLTLLEKYATIRGDEKDAYEYAVQVAKLTGKAIPTAPTNNSNGGSIFGKRKRKLKAIEERQELLSDSLQTLAAESDQLQTQSRRWRSKSTVLNRALASERERVQEMTEEQMIQELEMAKQRQMLDSLDFALALDSFHLAQQKSLLKQKEIEIRETKMKEELLQSRLNFWGAVGVLGLFLAFGLWSRYTNIKKYSTELEEKNTVIELEKERSNALLLNILPASVAEELKISGVAKARNFPSVTVMFTDFKDFSKKASTMTPEILVSELDFYFRKFDEIITTHNLEKIKTIGDAYMCAGGLPTPNKSHAKNVVSAAGEIQEFVRIRNTKCAAAGMPFFDVRIGIHTGPVVAGVVGEKKYAYDIWGDTVNIAARLESKCEPGSVNISKSTFDHIKTDFQFESRGKIAAKNIREIEMFYVKYG